MHLCGGGSSGGCDVIAFTVMSRKIWALVATAVKFGTICDSEYQYLSLQEIHFLHLRNKCQYAPCVKLDVFLTKGIGL